MTTQQLTPLGYMGVTNGRHWQTITASPGYPVDPSDQADTRAAAEKYAALTRTDAIDSGAVEDAGIRAGEIVGWRAWWLCDDGLLRSMVAQHVVWRPGEPIDASPDFYGFYGGVHSFKKLTRAMSEYGAPGYSPVVFGTVWHWGDVIEHENGYRSQFAAVRTLEAINRQRRDQPWWRRDPALKELRERYKDDLTDTKWHEGNSPNA